MSDQAQDLPRISVEDYEKLAPVATLESAGKPVHFSVPSVQTLWRVQSLETKEPDTLEWIAGFRSDEVLIDIGANVGMYTIWAGATVGLRVIAFEPESLNYALLNQNIMLNSLQERVTAYCVALSNSTGFGALFLSGFLAGGSNHTFGEEVDFHLRPTQAKYKQGCVSHSLDELIADGTVPFPTHIKIDVDGMEHKVIGGARETLKDKRLKSVLVELNTNLKLHRDLIGEITALGFALDAAQVNAAMRKEGRFKNIGNHIFRR